MAVFETWLKSDLKKPLTVKPLPGNLFSADNQGNLIGVEVMDGGSPAVLSGDVTGYVIRADGATLPISGTLDGNRASIVLPASAYAVIGHISIVIKVGTTTVGACTSYVYQTTTDTIVDPGQVLPSIADLLAQIEAAVATIPASWAGLMADIAPTYSDAAVYPVGAYVYYNGDLYRCTTAITTAESWTAGHWTQAALGNDVTDLKSAVNANAIRPNTNIFKHNITRTIIDGVTITPLNDFQLLLDGTATASRSVNIAFKTFVPHGDLYVYFEASGGLTSDEISLQGGYFDADGNVQQPVSHNITPNAMPKICSYPNDCIGSRFYMGIKNGVTYNKCVVTFVVSDKDIYTPWINHLIVQKKTESLGLIYPPILTIDLSNVGASKFGGDSAFLYFAKDTNAKIITTKAKVVEDLTSSYASYNSTTNELQINMPVEGVLYYDYKQNKFIIKSSNFIYPDNCIMLLYRYYTMMGGVLYDRYVETNIPAFISNVIPQSAYTTTSEVIYSPTSKIDLSSYSAVKFSNNADLLMYVQTNKYGQRRTVRFSEAATSIGNTYASYDSTNHVLTVSMPAESVLYYNPASNTVELKSNGFNIPAGCYPLLYRYYTSYGGEFFNTYYTRQFSDALRAAWLTPTLKEKYAEQIGNVLSAADYYRGSFTNHENKNIIIMMISDTHEDLVAIRNAIELSEDLDGVDCILHLGDLNAVYAPKNGTITGAAELKSSAITKPLLYAMGNHDEQGGGDPTQCATVSEAVSMVLSGINTESIYSTRGYGYYDFDAYKVRVIILNSFDYPSTATGGAYDFYGDNLLFQQSQIDFLVSTLNNVPSDYTVVIASHWCEEGTIDEQLIPQHNDAAYLNNRETQVGTNTYMSGLVVSEVIEAYKGRTTLSKTYTYTNGTVSGSVSVNANFASANGEFALWVCGHRHKACFANSTKGNFIIYANDTSCCGTWANAWATNYSNQPRCDGTNTRDLITCLSIDTANKKLKFTRIGAHVNRFLDDCNMIIIPYGSQT